MSESVSVPANLDPGGVKKLQEKADWVLAEAKKAGATDAEVGISLSQGLSVSVRLGEVETLEFHRDRGISLTLYVGQRKGTASSSDDSEASILRSIQSALDIARFADADEYAGVADETLLASEFPDLELWHPQPLSAERAIEQAQQCEQAGRADSRIVNSEGASVSSGETLRAYATSRGFNAGGASTSHSISCVLVGEQDGGMQRDYWYDSRRNPAQLASASAIGEEARRRTLARLGARKVNTGNYPVLFTPSVAASLLGHFAGAISGGALYRKSSFLEGELGSQLFPEWFWLQEAPRLPGGAYSAAWDHDGIPTQNRFLVQNGVLQSWSLGLYAARRLQLSPTGNGGGIRNVTVANSGENFSQLLRKMQRGLVLTEVMGPGVNIVTGDYSRGAAGFWVEQGEIQYPVDEFTVAGHLKTMLASIVASGTDVDDRGNFQVGSLLLESMAVAGV